MSEVYLTGTMKTTRGLYGAGLVVTTDPERPIDPSAEPPIFVDAARFASWRELGMLTESRGGEPRRTEAKKLPAVAVPPPTDDKKEDATNG